MAYGKTHFVCLAAVASGGCRRQLVVAGTEGVVEIRPLECGEYPPDYYANARGVRRE